MEEIGIGMSVNGLECHVKGRNFSSTSSIFGDFSRTCAIEGGQFCSMLAEYALLTAVDDEVIDELEIRCKAHRNRYQTPGLRGLPTMMTLFGR